MKKLSCIVCSYYEYFVLIVTFVGAVHANLLVSTTSGTVKGKKVDTTEGQVYQYLGIPYAQSPTGANRFKPPKHLPASAASLRFDATDFGPACYQPPHSVEVISPLLRTRDMIIDEDCLNLNIYVPKIETNEKLPVMIWLPGEGFDYADARQFEGTYLASLGKVILVTVNYRVSVFGFLSSETEDAPGNVGLLDQRMAFRWVAKNIEKFGGNSKNVTLFGRFSGAMSISMHMTSTYALNQEKKLFDRVILQSGIAVGSWVFDHDPSLAFSQLVELTKCSRNRKLETVKCLQNLPAEILLKHSLQVPQRWRPIIDGKFLTEEPMEAVKKGKYADVDVILGNNEDEGSLCLLTLYAHKSELYNEIQKKDITENTFKRLIADNLFQYFGKENNRIEKIVTHHYKYQHPSLRRNFIDFCGDLFIKSRIDQFSRLLATNNNKKGRVYRYIFAHRPSFSNQPQFLTATLGDDVLFSLGLVYQLDDIYEEKLLSRRMVVLFANFARFGKPDQFQQAFKSIWPEFTAKEKHIAKFSSDIEIIDGISFDRTNDLWFQILPSLKPIEEESTEISNYILASDLSGTEKKSNVYLIDKIISNETTEYVLIGLMSFTIILLIMISAILVAYVVSKSKFYTKLNESVS
ncbi:carboxylesterase 5A-like [Centruroides sculpturatus]|uniref:carboxylesterase 5A-like n=1 Tax=Centruroides sculpturatus TaxID=218467 RepID=UPI000C6DF338|nr:carboxylesterase 5A-like [Centruroides sculpturatus]